ncbi:MAG: Fic family protein [Desulfitobacteriaceae bacterium]
MPVQESTDEKVVCKIVAFNRIEELLRELNSYRPLSEGELLRFREEFLINFTYNSNAIEGNTLTLQETALIIKEGITIDKKPLKYHLEAIGHKEAYLYVEELVQQKVPLSEKVIKDIHSLVLMDKREDRGVYRRVPVTIMGAIHTPPQPYLVPVRMEQLIFKYQEISLLHVVERVSQFHLEFEAIHPFIDGNGRTGRLLLNLELIKEGCPPINIKFGDRKRYYDCFTSYHTNGENISELVSLVGEYLEEELLRYVEIVRNANEIESLHP